MQDVEKSNKEKSTNNETLVDNNKKIRNKCCMGFGQIKGPP